MTQLLNIWSWQGRIGRTRYLASGLILLAIKHNIDRFVAAAFGYPWSLFNYWVFTTSPGIESLTQRDAVFYSVLLAIALPFIWIGTVLTLRRLRDASLPLWLTVFFFLPFFNLIFFIILVAIPTAKEAEFDKFRSSKIGRFIPESEFGSATLGVLATVILTAGLTALSVAGLGQYGWGTFVGIPFFLGLNSTLIYGYHKPRSVGKCLLVALLSVALVGVALFAVAIEGIICLAMAFPLAVILALFGGFIGFVLQQRHKVPVHSFRVVSIAFLLMPGLSLLEYEMGASPTLYSVKSSVVIKAPPEKVWQNVVSFSELPSPTETLFKTGIAYPIRAEISGKGPGAVRHCVFSTGPFVEPITTWDEPSRLAFDVTAQPRSMDETSIYSDLRPPHVENYFVSRRGQFELHALPDGTTLLEGTTWYQIRYWPATYWHVWSDYIIHRIHLRVLQHIKVLAES